MRIFVYTNSISLTHFGIIANVKSNMKPSKNIFSTKSRQTNHLSLNKKHSNERAHIPFRSIRFALIGIVFGKAVLALSFKLW